MQNQQLILVSYSHKNTSVVFRDQIFLDNKDILKFIESANSNAEFIHEIAAISTCNRTEFCFLTSDPSSTLPWLEEQYRELKNIKISSPEFPQPAIMQNELAVSHLLEVSGGIQSMLLGENQILSQVKSAYELLLSSGQQFPVMNRLFQEAIRAGKAIRTHTSLCQGSVSISLATVELTRKIFSSFTNRHAVLIGAGETSELVALHFREMGVNRFSIVNRGIERREALASKYKAAAYPLEDIPTCLVKADVVVTATHSPSYLITAEICREAMNQRKSRPLLIVDISTPRNVEPAVAEIPQIFLYDIDNIKFVIAENLEKRKKEIPAAKKIVKEICNDFWDWYKTLEIVPTISKLHTYFNSVRDQEVRKYVHKTDEKEYERLEALSKSIVQRLLHYPIADLRQQGNSGKYDLTKINALWNLFRLGELEDNNS